MEASIWKPNDETLNLKKNEKLIQKNASAFNGKNKYELRNKTTVPIWLHRECRKAARKNKICISFIDHQRGIFHFFQTSINTKP